jgi:transcriptional regulator with XRE-family HTH domain
MRTAYPDIARRGCGRNAAYRSSAKEVSSTVHYGADMPHEIAVLLGSALRDIRRRTTGTQDRWTARTGMSQSYLSSAERGESGWESVKTIAGHIEAVGVDPLELLKLAVLHADADTTERELLTLWSAASEDTRKAILILLKNQAGARAVAR